MKTKNKLIIIILSLTMINIICFYYKEQRLKKYSNIPIPKIKYTCTSTAINTEDMIYYKKIVIEVTNAGRIVNYYNGVQTLYKSDETYNNSLNSLAKDNETLYQDIGDNSIYTFAKLSADENNNNVVAKTLKDLNNLDMKCVKEKINI